MSPAVTVHIIYIHGFQGNDTTFRRFPTDLQNYLTTFLNAQHTRFRTRSSLYPTYKSTKPIANATQNFLEWLSLQPPSPVILLGHSMGGLLAADAATSPSQKSSKCKHPIIGMIAFDTPYLGMHPHVVITGIASLFAKKEEQDASPANAETVLNDSNVVQFHDNRVTDDWDEFKKTMPPQSRSTSQLSVTSPSPADHPSALPNSAIPRPPPQHSASSSSSRSNTSSKHRVTPPALQKMLNKLPAVVKDHPSVQGFISTHADKLDKPFTRWLTKHSDDPLGASKAWVVERLQFGSCMFDAKDLKDRYGRLVKWNWQGGWVNYWTITTGLEKEKTRLRRLASDTKEIEQGGEAKSDQLAVDKKDNDAALKETVLTPTSESTPNLEPPPEKQRRGSSSSPKPGEKSPKRERSPSPPSPRHFVVLPTGLGAYLGGADSWEQIVIDGAEDEVAAHLGMFMEDQNLGYDKLVKDTAEKILGWCKRAGI